MAKQKIAILGGGMAGLSAAYELTKTEALRQRHDVTVYQMGWRLGGKAASSRDDRGRVQEHGLHVWFGCYENAFGLIREVYSAWKRDTDCPLKSWRDAFTPQDCTPIGDRVEGRHTFHPVQWPRRSGDPGTATGLPTMWESVVSMLELAYNATRAWSDAHPHASLASGRAPQWALDQYDQFFREKGKAAKRIAPRRLLSSGQFADISATMDAALAWACSFDGSAPLIIAKRHSHHGIVALLHTAHEGVRKVNTSPSGDDVMTRLLEQMLDVVAAFLNGLFTDFIIGERTLDELDEFDFRAWLLRHGGSSRAVQDSALVKCLYDTMFQYQDGDLQRPSYAAGTAVQVVLRIVASYTGAVLYLMRAGMGEVVISPIYQTLKARGVKFKFFHKVTRLDLDSGGKSVAAIRIHRQADVVGGRDYCPTLKLNGLDCWPARPHWEQIVGGAAMARAGVDFESHWCQWPPAAEEVLTRGHDFDAVVLAMSLGAFMRLNEAPGPCDALIEACPAFRQMTIHAGLVPSQAVQLWFDKTAAQLGWPFQRATTVSGAPPLDIWADMTPTLVYQPLTPGEPTPQSVHYLCGVLDTQLYRKSPAEADTANRALELVKRNTEQWLKRGSEAIWPKAHAAGTFDWQTLIAPHQSGGTQRLLSQYLRANIDPTECCVGSAKGATKWRLRADGSGFVNLYLAGCWTRTGMNTTCLEAAVMSGRQASRAICGSPDKIVGEDFMRTGGLGACPLVCLRAAMEPLHPILTWLRRDARDPRRL